MTTEEIAQEAINLRAILRYMEETIARRFDPSHVVTLIALIANRLEKASAESHLSAQADVRAATISFRREWIESVIRTLSGPLPSGHIGDVVFLLRDQLRDALSDAKRP